MNAWGPPLLTALIAPVVLLLIQSWLKRRDSGESASAEVRKQQLLSGDGRETRLWERVVAVEMQYRTLDEKHETQLVANAMLEARLQRVIDERDTLKARVTELETEMKELQRQLHTARGTP